MNKNFNPNSICETETIIANIKPKYTQKNFSHIQVSIPLIATEVWKFFYTMKRKDGSSFKLILLGFIWLASYLLELKLVEEIS